MLWSAVFSSFRTNCKCWNFSVKSFEFRDWKLFLKSIILWVFISRVYWHSFLLSRWACGRFVLWWVTLQSCKQNNIFSHFYPATKIWLQSFAAKNLLWQMYDLKHCWKFCWNDQSNILLSFDLTSKRFDFFLQKLHCQIWFEALLKNHHTTLYEHC